MGRRRKKLEEQFRHVHASSDLCLFCLKNAKLLQGLRWGGGGVCEANSSKSRLKKNQIAPLFKQLLGVLSSIASKSEGHLYR